jgi:hypothetical protein
MIIAYIDGERKVFSENDTSNFGWTNGLLHIECQDGTSYYIFEDAETAGKAAREYWKDLAENDPTEFACIVGEKNLIQWGMGHYAGPGSTQVISLEEWLDLHLDIPEEHFASYDGNECGFKSKHPDFESYTVAYRHN